MSLDVFLEVSLEEVSLVVTGGGPGGGPGGPAYRWMALMYIHIRERSQGRVLVALEGRNLDFLVMWTLACLLACLLLAAWRARKTKRSFSRSPTPANRRRVPTIYAYR